MIYWFSSIFRKLLWSFTARYVWIPWSENCNKHWKNIFQDIVELKQREFRTKYNCRCKGFCQINHSRYSWVKQKSDSIIELLRKTVDNSKYDNNDFSEHPKERSSDLICLHCNSILKDRPSLRSHINVHHESNLPMECEQCNQLITNKSNITTHRES